MCFREVSVDRVLMQCGIMLQVCAVGYVHPVSISGSVSCGFYVCNFISSLALISFHLVDIVGPVSFGF